MARQLLKTVGKTEIYVDEDGRFSAHIDGKYVQRVRISDIERMISVRVEPEGGPAMKVTARISFYGDLFMVERVEVLAKERGRYRISRGNPPTEHTELLDSYGTLYAIDEAAMGAMAKLNEEYLDLMQRAKALWFSLPKFELPSPPEGV